MPEKKKPYVVWFSEIGKEDIPLVGGKGANLGEMTQVKIPVPPGFIVTALAYYHFLEINSLRKQIKDILQDLDANNSTQLSHASRKVKELILHARIPTDVARSIIDAYMKLSSVFSDALVAVRSSATAEDLPDASFAGQQETFLNVKGESNVVQAVRQCWASLFEERALFYREQHHFDHFKVGIAVPVQKMVQSDVSGVMFTINPTTNDKSHLIIESVYGLGETIVQGSVNPDHYEVHKKTLEITKKELSTQEKQLVLTRQGNKELPIAKSHQSKQKLSDSLIQEVARLGKRIEAHYYFPQDIEWAVEKGKVFIVQSRPVTTIQKVDAIAAFKGPISLPIILKGAPASPGIAFGPVKIIHSKKEMGKIRKGDILVTEMTTPDFVPAMKKAAAIVTDLGGRTCHAAIVSRELGLPCVVGANQATKKLVNGMIVTVNGTTGDVYKGAIPVESKTLEYVAPEKHTSSELKTATKVYVNLAEP
ncbi:MAG TPA: phosphoenolpyruvate synthase, partial [Patescibacteria group bacterium]|nr:phosphoenolpyruvate synthase [Patescibacteria group bacterium]